MMSDLRERVAQAIADAPEVDFHWERYWQLADIAIALVVDELGRERDALVRERDALREALRPLAKVGKLLAEHPMPKGSVAILYAAAAGPDYDITSEHALAAHAALTASAPPSPQTPEAE